MEAMHKMIALVMIVHRWYKYTDAHLWYKYTDAHQKINGDEHIVQKHTFLIILP